MENKLITHDWLKLAESYFLMNEAVVDPSGTYEARMWVSLFRWVGWEAV